MMKIVGKVRGGIAHFEFPFDAPDGEVLLDVRITETPLVALDTTGDDLNDADREELHRRLLESWDAPTIPAAEAHRQIRAALEERTAAGR